MQFKLRRPCKHCPFRNDRPAFLTASRVEEITDAILKEDKTFACHQTLSGEWDEDEDGNEAGYRGGKGDQMCAGALVMIEKTGARNQMTQIAERIGLWDPSKLDMDSPVFPTARAMIDAQDSH